MVERVGGDSRADRTGTSTGPDKAELKKLEQKKLQKQFAAERSSDGLQSSAPAAVSTPAEVQALAPVTMGQLAEALATFTPLEGLLLSAPPDGVEPDRAFRPTDRAGQKPQPTTANEPTRELLEARTGIDVALDQRSLPPEVKKLLVAAARVLDAKVAEIAAPPATPPPASAAAAAQRFSAAFAPLVQSLRQVMKNGKPDATPAGRAAEAASTARALRDSAGADVITVDLDALTGSAGALPQFSLAELDIDALIQLVMMEIAKDSEKDLRDVMQEMEKTNKEKALHRKVQQALRGEHLRLEQEMRAEFNTLKGQGLIREDVTFEDYSSWRKVVVAEPMTDPTTGELMVDGAGNPILAPGTLADPRPPEVPYSMRPPVSASPSGDESGSATTTDGTTGTNGTTGTSGTTGTTEADAPAPLDPHTGKPVGTFHTDGPTWEATGPWMSEKDARAEGYIFVLVNGEPTWVSPALAQERGLKDGDRMDLPGHGTDVVSVLSVPSAYEKYPNPPKKPKLLGSLSGGMKNVLGGLQTAKAVQTVKSGHAMKSANMTKSGQVVEQMLPSTIKTGSNAKVSISAALASNLAKGIAIQGSGGQPDAPPPAADLPMPGPDPVQTIPSEAEGRMMSLAELDAREKKETDTLDSLSEMSQMVQFRLQIFMDRRAKAITTLSNVMQKIAEVQSGIIKNLT